MRSGLDGEMKRRWEVSLFISALTVVYRAIAMKLIVWATFGGGSSLRASSSHTCTTGRGTACSGPCLMLIQSEFESKTSATH